MPKVIKANIDWKQAYEDYKSGMTLQQTGNRLGISAPTVCKYFKALGFESRTASESYKMLHNTHNIEWERCYGDYVSGKTLKQIADVLGVSHTTVHNYFVREGFITIKKRCTIDWGKSYEDYKSGMSMQQVGNKIGVSKQRVHQMYVRLGYKRRCNMNKGEL